MDETFFSKSNFEMLYNLIDDHMIKTYSSPLDNLEINARTVIYESMVHNFAIREDSQKLEDINKLVLKACLPKLQQNIPKLVVADEKVNVFIKPEESNKEPVIVDKENLEGTPLNIKLDEKDSPKTSDLQRDLDISSSDRNEWSSNSSDSPYSFVVHLGVSDTFPGIGTPISFQNVVSVNITHAILPDTLTESLDKYPYLYLQIDELQGAYQSTSDHGRRSFVKLLKDKKWLEATGSNISYNLMNTKGNGAKPSVGWNVDTPIATLSKLTIRILTPNGFPLKLQNDVLEIDTIEETASDIVITCTNVFSPNTIHANNRIGFKHLDLTTPDPQKQTIITFLENTEHMVVSVTSNQTINIRKSIESYAANGTPTYTDFGSTASGTIDIDGFLMNLSFQSNFGFNIKSLRHIFKDTPRIV
tara:strand:+ start:10994 stop:12244 length:1251 start_codon:yes stop_codon:yes gene_type:complete